MEPEEIKRLEKFEEQIDRMFDVQSRKLYDYMLVEGAEAFKEGNPLNKFLKTDLFERLIAHFESTEEYERCAFLLDLSNKVKKDYIKKSLEDLQ